MAKRSYKRKRKTQKRKRITQKKRRKTKKKEKLWGGDGGFFTFLAIGTLSREAIEELRNIMRKNSTSQQHDIKVVFVIEPNAEYDMAREFLSEITKDVTVIKTDFLVVDAGKRRSINIKSQYFQITSLPPSESEMLDESKCDELEDILEKSKSVVIINGYVYATGRDPDFTILSDDDVLKKEVCYRKEENIFLECIPAMVNLILRYSGKIREIYTQLIDRHNNHVKFLSLNLPFYYYFIMNLYTVPSTFDHPLPELVNTYLEEGDPENEYGIRCLREQILTRDAWVWAKHQGKL